MPEPKLTDAILLVQLEARVDRGLAGAEDALEALLKIHRLNLYLSYVVDVPDDPDDPNGPLDKKWRVYCARRWPRHVRTIQKLLQEVRVAEQVSGRPLSDNAPGGTPKRAASKTKTPKTPVPGRKQARELGRLPAESARIEVWKALCVEADGGKPTNAAVKAAVDQYLAAAGEKDPTVAEVVAAAAERQRRATAEVDQDTVDDGAEKVRKVARAWKKRWGDRAATAAGHFEAGIAAMHQAAGTTP